MKEKPREWYISEIVKLLAIVRHRHFSNGFIGRAYVDEKLTRILDGTGIGVPPSLHGKIRKIIRTKKS